MVNGEINNSMFHSGEILLGVRVDPISDTLHVPEIVANTFKGIKDQLPEKTNLNVIKNDISNSNVDLSKFNTTPLSLEQTASLIMTNEERENMKHQKFIIHTGPDIHNLKQEILIDTKNNIDNTNILRYNLEKEKILTQGSDKNDLILSDILPPPVDVDKFNEQRIASLPDNEKNLLPWQLSRAELNNVKNEIESLMKLEIKEINENANLTNVHSLSSSEKNIKL